MTEKDIYAKLEELVGEKTKGQKVTPEVKLSDLGLDSLDKADIMIRIEDEFGISFNEDEMVGVSTVGELEKTIETKLADKK